MQALLRTLRGLVPAAAAALVLAGGGTASAPTPLASGGTWVGPVQASDAFVAIVSDGEQIVAYVCDNGTVGTWFFGSDGSAPHQQLVARGGSLLDVTLGTRATGTFTHAGRVYSFEARAAKRPVLFRADANAAGTGVLAGWIQNGDESRGTLALGSTLQTAPTLQTTVPVNLNLTQLVLTPAPMTPDTLAASTTNTTRFVWGAMGDSFASGEGDPLHGIDDPTQPTVFDGVVWSADASTFVPDGFSLRSDATTCHRSDRAGAPKANALLKSLYPGVGFALGFVACSGATTENLEAPGYTGPSVESDAQLGFVKVPQPAQLDRIASFRAAQDGQLDALYMSIGGNNVNFGPIVQDCITPFAGDCADKDSGPLSVALSGLGASYTTLAGAIHLKLPGTPPAVLISEYPNPLDHGAGGRPCQGTDFVPDAGGFDNLLAHELTGNEAAWAYTIPGMLDQTISMAAQSNGWVDVSEHTPLFLGHGVCTAQPFINLNSAAVQRQGEDLSKLTGFSNGFMHPNDLGYQAYGNAIAADLRQFVDPRVRSGLVAPANLRIAAANANGGITVRWDDRSTSENAAEVEVLPARTQDAAQIIVPSGATPVSGAAGTGFRARVLGVGVQQFVQPLTGGGRFLYRVRACQTGIVGGTDAQCGPWTGQISGTNVLPAAPTGLHLATSTVFVGGRITIQNLFLWSAQPDAIEYDAREDYPDGSSTEIRTSGTQMTATLLSGVVYRVAACNRVGCTGFVSISG
jgi:hypothetical protein